VCGNAGALLIVGKELECIPKLIYPCAELEDAWLRSEDMRPATPPRQLARAERRSSHASDGDGGGGGGLSFDLEGAAQQHQHVQQAAVCSLRCRHHSRLAPLGQLAAYRDYHPVTSFG
jgi:hypothetical protein